LIDLDVFGGLAVNPAGDFPNRVHVTLKSQGYDVIGHFIQSTVHGPRRIGSVGCSSKSALKCLLPLLAFGSISVPAWRSHWFNA